MTPPACENCGTGLRGEYCHACGQRVLPSGRVTLREALEVSSSEILNVEPKTFRSIRKLFVPGRVTAEFLAGHRVEFTAPLRLYLACAAIFFLCAPLAGFTLEHIQAQDTAGQLSAMVDRAIADSGLSPDRFRDRFDIRFQSVYTASLFASMLAGAGMLALLYRRQRRPFAAHVIFELHYVSFLYLVTIALGLLLRLLPPGRFLGFAATMAVLVPYLFFALRRVYRESAAKTALKTLAMILFGLVFDNLVNFAALLVTLELV